jgi:AbrB family looped-hinge helix DNA binding protein
MAIPDAPLQYLTTTKIGEKGQLTVPKQFRRDLGLGSGSPFAVLRLGDGLILLPEQRRFERLCQRISSTLTAAGLTPSAILSTLPKAREQVFSEHYGADSKKTTSGASRNRARIRRRK